MTRIWSFKECSVEILTQQQKKIFGKDFNKNYIMEMAKYILQILRIRIFVVMSWGFDAPVAIENGLRFNVNGFKYTGIVEVVYDAGKDLFEVRICGTGEIVEDVYLDNLVEVIDSRVEKVENYTEVVNSTYNIA